MKLKETLCHLLDPPVVAKLGQLLAQAKTLGLRDEDFINAKEAFDANEWELSFDTIVTQLDEFEVSVTVEFIALAEDIIGELQIAPNKYWFLNRMAIRDSQA